MKKMVIFFFETSKDGYLKEWHGEKSMPNN
jgi:hypothetical protein